MTETLVEYTLGHDCTAMEASGDGVGTWPYEGDKGEPISRDANTA